MPAESFANLGIKVRVVEDEVLLRGALEYMCGIAGYSLSTRSAVDRTLAAQSLLAGIAERGADAVGYAYRGPEDAYPVVAKQRTPASELLDRVSVPQSSTELLVHVRDYTKGHPSISANNHPVRHGPVVGIHNGIILNDDELLAPHACARSEARMTVDSEAIFALAAHSGNDARALEELDGSFATAWLDSRVAGTLFVARGAGRPLWFGSGKHELFFASTRAALEVVEQYTGVKLRKRELKMGTFLALRDARIVRDERFRPDLSYTDPVVLPAIRAPQEGRSCLARLAALATLAA